MSSREFSEWQAYYNMEPFGHQRMDIGFALVAATVANSVRDPDKKLDAYTVDQFLLTFNEYDEAEREAAQQEKLRQKLFGVFGGPVDGDAG